MKLCGKCRVNLPDEDFYVDKHHKGRLSTFCRNCQNVPLLTKDQYNEIHEKQNGLCSICSKPEKMVKKSSDNVYRLCVDHNHTTGVVRGLLCHNCNTALGKFKDRPEVLLRAYEYLKE